jgi:hypothetical protein
MNYLNNLMTRIEFNITEEARHLALKKEALTPELKDYHANKATTHQLAHRCLLNAYLELAVPTADGIFFKNSLNQTK